MTININNKEVPYYNRVNESGYKIKIEKPYKGQLKRLDLKY